MLYIIEGMEEMRDNMIVITGFSNPIKSCTFIMYTYIL